MGYWIHRPPEFRKVLEPELVIEKIPWVCLDCKHRWMDRADCKGIQRRGCPKCGSHRLIDINVTFVGYL